MSELLEGYIGHLEGVYLPLNDDSPLCLTIHQEDKDETHLLIFSSLETLRRAENELGLVYTRVGKIPNDDKGKELFYAARMLEMQLTQDVHLENDQVYGQLIFSVINQPPKNMMD